MQQNNNTPEMGALRLYLALIKQCFEPINTDINIWKSFKNGDGEWKKERVSLSKQKVEEIMSNEISSRRQFLATDKGIKILVGCFCSDDKILEKYDDFVRGGCKGDMITALRYGSED